MRQSPPPPALTGMPCPRVRQPLACTLERRFLPTVPRRVLLFTLQECPEGTYTDRTGADSVAACLPAPAGNYAAGTGNDGFTPCEPGTYQDQPGKGACKVGKGVVEAGVGSVGCPS